MHRNQYMDGSRSCTEKSVVEAVAIEPVIYAGSIPVLSVQKGPWANLRWWETRLIADGHILAP